MTRNVTKNYAVGKGSGDKQQHSGSGENARSKNDDPTIKEKVRQIMDMTRRSEEEVCLALHECDNDTECAINMLFEDMVEVNYFVLFVVSAYSVNVFVFRVNGKRQVKRKKIGRLLLVKRKQRKRLLSTNGMRLQYKRLIKRSLETRAVEVHHVFTADTMIAGDVSNRLFFNIFWLV